MNSVRTPLARSAVAGYLVMVAVQGFAWGQPPVQTGQITLASFGFNRYYGFHAGDDFSRDVGISGNGRFVAYNSRATNLVPLDTNYRDDTFVYDARLNRIERVSVSSQGVQSEQGHSQYTPSLSYDGRFVAFSSNARELVPGDRNERFDVFVRDRLLGTVERVSVSSAGVEGNGESVSPSMSYDGRFVAFQSSASNLVPGDTHGSPDVFVRDRLLGLTTCVSVALAGYQPFRSSTNPFISADGRFVAFFSEVSNFVRGDGNGKPDVFVHDRTTGLTACASVTPSGLTGNGLSFPGSISADGRFVSFTSEASNLVEGDNNGRFDVFVRDMLLGTTTLESVTSSGVQGHDSSLMPAISGDGRWVVFSSYAALVPETSWCRQIYLRDRLLGQTIAISRGPSGQLGDEHSSHPFVDASGNAIAFESTASNLTTMATSMYDDAYLYRVDK